MASINQRMNATPLDLLSRRELMGLLQDRRADIAVVKAAINGITAKLDADAGVTGTDYSALWPAATTNLTI